jgi:hypothetical protein
MSGLSELKVFRVQDYQGQRCLGVKAKIVCGQDFQMSKITTGKIFSREVFNMQDLRNQDFQSKDF